MSKDDSHLIWEDIESETLYDARIFKLRTVHRRSPEGKRAPFVSVDAPDWVTIIPELDNHGEKSFLIVRQYRHGTEEVSMEFPAGMVDPGEKPVDAAVRELLEETGYSADEMIQVGAVSPNPAFMTNISYTFLARGLKKVADQNLDQHEILDVHSEAYPRLQQVMGKDAYASAITVQAWYFYLRFAGKMV